MAEQKDEEVIIVEKSITEGFEVHFKESAQSIRVAMSGKFGFFYASISRPQLIIATLNVIRNREIKNEPGSCGFVENKIKEWHIYGSIESLRVAFELE